jgi:hypothetical protein
MNLRSLSFSVLLLCCLPCVSQVSWAQSASKQEEKSESLRQQGNQAMDEGKYAEALKFYKEAYQTHPNPALHYNMANVYRAMGDYPKALESIVQFDTKASASLKSRVPDLNQLIQEIRSKVSILDLKCNVDGASILVNKLLVGTTPVSEPLKLSQGNVEIVVSKEGYSSYTTTISLKGGQEHHVDVRLTSTKQTGILVVKSNAVGALVSIDGKNYGTVPAEASIPSGNHRVLVTHNDYKPANLSTFLDIGQRKELSVSLEKKSSSSVFSTWWFWTGVGVVVAGGITVTVMALTEGPASKGTVGSGQIGAPLVSF